MPLTSQVVHALKILVVHWLKVADQDAWSADPAELKLSPLGKGPFPADAHSPEHEGGSTNQLALLFPRQYSEVSSEIGGRN